MAAAVQQWQQQRADGVGVLMRQQCAYVHAYGGQCLAGAVVGRSAYCVSHDPRLSARRAVLAKAGAAMKARTPVGVRRPVSSEAERQYREVWRTIMERGAEWT